jgi:hypothetical protein
MSQKNPVFIGGPGCLEPIVARVLGSHPHIVCGPGLDLIHSVATAGKDVNSAMTYLREFQLDTGTVDQAFSKLSRSILGVSESGKSGQTFVEVDAKASFCFNEIHRIFPESPLIFILRDVRDLVAQEFASATVAKERDQRQWRQTKAGELSKKWLQMIVDGSTSFKAFGPQTRTCLLRLEGLLINPRKWLGELLSFLDIELVENEIQALEATAMREIKQASPALVGSWREELTPEERSIIETICGGALRDLNYFGL